MSQWKQESGRILAACCIVPMLRTDEGDRLYRYRPRAEPGAFMESRSALLQTFADRP